MSAERRPAADLDEPKPKDATKEAGKEDPKRKRALLARQLAIAAEKVKKARLALAHQQAEDQDKIARKSTERELVETKLRDFEGHNAPQRIEEARLELRRAEDSVKDAEEELAQLEMMYAEEDLADKTREIVLERGRRRLERARRDLDLKRTALANLEEHDLPREAAELRAQAADKASELEGLQRASETNLLDKQIALMEAEAEVTRLQAEIDELDEEGGE
ncbi:MAG: hypothetical protein JSU68_14095 [Phycisphaerales bacterium]|nr:MAG: hypothetical protein JSU68_14095 [Phycisphaerales bacterium]